MTSDPFADWPEPIRAEFQEGNFGGQVGQALVSETDRVRVWHLTLQPGERIGFHRHVLDYFWTVLGDGRARSHYGDGTIADAAYRQGDTRHFVFEKGESMVHDLANTGETPLSFVTVELKDSANAPLPLPVTARDAEKPAA